MSPNLLDIVNFIKGNNKTYPFGVLHSSEAFRNILERERARAERTGQFFSLVVLGIDKENGIDVTSMKRLGNIIRKKVRLCDEVGWYEDNRIGTILPGTSVEGAQHFSEVIKERIGDIAPRLTCRIYSYPSSEIISGVQQKDAVEAQASFETDKSIERPNNLFSRPVPIGKRLVDFSLAVLLLILLSPLCALVALFIKIVSPGPVFFRQIRVGYMGRPFMLWKFRTMHANSNPEIHRKHISNAIENDTPVTKLDDLNDNRIIPLGKLLRASGIDELPQLLNVILGDMSLVGPRPILHYEAEKFLPWQKRRCDILPGISGLWQVSGKNRTTFNEMIRFDIRYSRTTSLWEDAKILLFTLPAVLGLVFEYFSNKSVTKKKITKVATIHRQMPYV